MSNLREVDVCLKRIRELEQALDDREVDVCLKRIRELEQALDEAPSRDRLRELEAELADLRTYRDLHYCGEKGIVERATAELKARAEKAEARVAELTDLLNRMTDLLNRIFEHAGRVRFCLIATISARSPEPERESG